ncbi:MAG: peptidoglycan DD-metalloendopeptidase family protein [Gallionella sp.]|nr:peptidoglycan DD-metalloendopeptidase family protein [Gallionella sp.]
MFCLIANNTSFAATQQKELENLRKRIIAVQREVEQTDAFKLKAANALRESEHAISNSNRRIAELSEQRKLANKKLSKLQTQQYSLSSSIQVQQQLLSKQLYLQYTNGSTSYVEQFFNSQETSQLARNLQYYQYIARDRATGINALRSNLDVLKTNRTETLEQSAALTALSAEEIVQRSFLKRSQQARQQMLKKFSQQLRQQRREVNRLQRDETHLARLVDKLAKILAQPKSNSIFSNDNLPDNRFDEYPFEKLKGKLALPVKGAVTNHFGTPRPDSTVLWKGLFLKTANGQAVKSVAAGRVVFADWLRGFGNLLIVDHGMGYMSLYGNNETLFKQVGDLLIGGDTIASVGNSGGNEESGLYFELRHESKPFDPIKWLAAK